MSPEFRQIVGAPNECPFGITAQTLPNPRAAVGHGPGAELKSLLAGWPFYITASPDCSCNFMAGKMDVMGCEWCESPGGLAEILAAMRENAEKRGIPFIDAVGRMLVKRAIHNARKATIR